MMRKEKGGDMRRIERRPERGRHRLMQLRVTDRDGREMFGKI